jgi:hypothetical protein
LTGALGGEPLGLGQVNGVDRDFRCEDIDVSANDPDIATLIFIKIIQTVEDDLRAPRELVQAA